jgi:hypothetical protein
MTESKKQYVEVRMLRSDKQFIEKFEGDTFASKFHIAISGSEMHKSIPATDGAVVTLSVHSSEFSNLAECAVMDLQNDRCLRHAPRKKYPIDPETCEACQFKGMHYPPDLNGLTPRELGQIERQQGIVQDQKAIQKMKLDAEKERSDRMPARVIY